MFGAGVLLSLLASLMDQLGIPPPAQEISDALEWNYYGAMAPFPLLMAVLWVLLLGYLIGGIGLVCFTRWSRGVLLLVIVLSVLITPFSGLSVSRGLPLAISSLGSMLLLIPLVLSFFPPCSGYFQQNTGAGNPVPNEDGG